MAGRTYASIPPAVAPAISECSGFSLLGAIGVGEVRGKRVSINTVANYRMRLHSAVAVRPQASKPSVWRRASYSYKTTLRMPFVGNT